MPVGMAQQTVNLSSRWFDSNPFLHYRHVIQLVECSALNRVVGGSTPSVPAKIFPLCADGDSTMYYVPREFFQKTRYWVASVGRCNGGWVQIVILGCTWNLRWTKKFFKETQKCHRTES